MTMWHPASNGAGRRHWFLIQEPTVPLADRYLMARDGVTLIRFASMESAQRRADRLNR